MYNTMKIKKIFIAGLLFIAISTGIWLLIETTSEITSPDGQIVVSVHKDDDNLIELEIVDKKHGIREIKKTRSAIYLKYKIYFWSNEHFLFESSDTGSVLFSRSNNKWVGTDVLSFLNPTKKCMVILLPEKEKIKHEDGIDEKSNKLTGSSTSEEPRYELLIFSNSKSKLIFTGEWYHFPEDDSFYNIIEWISPNEFTLNKEKCPRLFRITDGNIFQGQAK